MTTDEHTPRAWECARTINHHLAERDGWAALGWELFLGLVIS